ncbi:MAG: endonuclease MutS2 [bacterium]
MDNHSLDVLGFDIIKERLSLFACSELGKRLCREISPKLEKTKIEDDLKQVQQAKEAISIFGRIPLAGLKDINPILIKLDGNGPCLDIQELLTIRNFLDVTQEVAHWLSNIRDNYSSIKLFKKRLVLLDKLKIRLDNCIDPSGEVKDSASPLLAKIRRELRQEKDKIIQILEGLLMEKDGKEAFQSDFVTIRNDRYVIPVKANKKGMLQGIVHDESGSGATLFIEPMISVDAQNKFYRLKIKEKDEIKRIIHELSELVMNFSESLRVDLWTLGELDFIQSKALFSSATEGIAPIISHDLIIRLRGAKHTLLIFRHKDSPEMGSEPVAIDIELNRKTRALVISGPNTGGKTVTLKMVGLLQIMVQSGLHIPVKEGSELGIFNEILADIGDEQDIEKDLSSFSSHIKNISRILNHIGPKSIVLLDELGSDTNPTEGAALGMAVLEYILKKGALCLVTTHHNGLKAYAASSENNEIRNASMGFDPDLKKPTYILHMGFPGSSNALGICSKLGLPDEILEKARTVMGEGEVQLEDLLFKIERDEGLLKEELEKQKNISQQMESVKERYNLLLSSIKEREKRIAKETHSRIQATVEQARKDIERLVGELKRSELTSKGIKSAHKELREVVHKFTPKSYENKKYKGLDIDKISIGQPVLIYNLNEEGVVSRIDQTENKVWVMVGPLKFRVKADELAPVKGQDHKQSKEMVSSASMTIPINSSVLTRDISTQLIVIGQRVDEALQKIDKYLDNAILAHLSSVSIIHGKGTGTLKKAIEEFLNAHPQVASFRSGKLQEGGAGVTVVELAA